MAATRPWEFATSAGLLFAWIVFREWAALLGGAVAVVGSAMAYRSRPRGWPSLRRVLGNLALLDAAASLVGALTFWPLSSILFPRHDDLERALWVHGMLALEVGGPSFLIGAALRMGL